MRSTEDEMCKTNRNVAASSEEKLAPLAVTDKTMRLNDVRVRYGWEVGKDAYLKISGASVW